MVNKDYYNLAGSLNLPTGLYILLALISFFNLCQIISGSTVPFSRSFHQMKGICMNFLDLELFFDSFRDIAMATDFGGKICKMTFIQHAGISQRIRISKFRFKGVKSTIFATFCAISVKISPLTPNITQGVSVPFGTRRQKMTYHTKYLSKYWTKLFTNFPASVGSCMQIIKLK